MESGIFREHLQLLLLNILESGPQSGLQIIQQVQERTGGFFDLRMGHLYPVLHELEQDQQVLGEFRATSRGGALVKYYALTPRGSHEVQARKSELEQLTRTLPFLLR
ncbi:PadR family transcriptional regulator [Deinococcus cellulosilyticus]|uniref:PadR family transcriptional regulator n=1 Tax=Deinococcus cellulosilyticus TaxID=401558 RepID=UPI001FEC8770|nr:PadR family transcriptional regulator [Deinococcus cellulosilyticus]